MSELRRHRVLVSGLATGLALVLALAMVLLLSPARSEAPVPASSQRPAAAPWPHRPPVIAFLGDSWTEGVGATGFQGYAPRTAARLGWHYLNFGIGGSGYTQPGAHHNLFAQRIAAIVASHPDVVVVEGSLNDKSSTPTAEAAAAYTTLSLLHAELGRGTPIIVLGASYNPGTPNTTIDWINAAIAGAAKRVGLPFINPAPLNWTDPRNSAVWYNSLHPNDRGHQLIASHLAPLIRTLVLR